MPRQRWYAGKGREPRLRALGEWRPPTADTAASARALLVADDSASPAAVYQVPVTVRVSALAAADKHLIGCVGPDQWVYDGVHDGAFTGALLAMVLTSRRGEPHGATAWGERSPRAPRADPGALDASVFAGEQSNTSIVYRGVGVAPIVIKVFRQLHHGENPDVTLQTALAEAGSTHVPSSVGALVGEWPDAGGRLGRGHLAFAQEFIPGATDGWQLALSAAASGRDFTEEARAMGDAVAHVHRTLAQLFGTGRAEPGEVAATVSRWRSLLAGAVDEVPSLAAHREAILAVYERAARSPHWPPLQRIHGDLHLGQVLHAPGRDWMLLDFEGEPLRPLPERVLPDAVARDIAGMLRSFDYAGGAAGREDAAGRAAGAARDGAADLPLEAWVAQARDAFLHGYADAGGADLAALQSILDAYELDKAVYEAVYEQRNRPAWLPIPLNGIRRLVG